MGDETIVVAGLANMLKVRATAELIAYRTRATQGRQLARNFTATIKGFNDTYGQSCKSWADVAEAIKVMTR